MFRQNICFSHNAVISTTFLLLKIAFQRLVSVYENIELKVITFPVVLLKTF